MPDLSSIPGFETLEDLYAIAKGLLLGLGLIVVLSIAFGPSISRIVRGK